MLSLVVRGVVGIMSKLSFELDPVVMIALLMTIGMSVDYIAHVAYHFQVLDHFLKKHHVRKYASKYRPFSATVETN